jgi:hypothetical protein
MVKIIYREFYDIPRVFVVPYNGMKLLFECLFDESIGEYPDYYNVFTLSNIKEEDLQGSWVGLSKLATRYLGQVPICEVKFDQTKRKEINSEVIERLINDANRV